MTENTYLWTKGPWVAEKSCSGQSPDAGCAVIASHDANRISSPSRGIVAWVTRHVGKQTNSEIEANARLIAAAPELYEALQNVLPYAQACIGLPECSWPADSVILQARAALAKARGKP
jgi:hypothetical protein